MPARIALVGAPGTGKTTLSHELAGHLRARGHRVIVRTRGEGMADAAPACDLVVEDAPSWPAPGDGALHPAQASRPDLTLLMGLDLPACGDPSPGAAQAPDRQVADARLRAALTGAGVGWRVIYGQGSERVQQALDAVAAVLPWAWERTASEEDVGRWSRLRASCEKCGDADCEHRLFTGGALRATAPPT